VMHRRILQFVGCLWAGLSWAASAGEFTPLLGNAEALMATSSKDHLSRFTKALSDQLQRGLLLDDRELIARWLLVDAVTYALPPVEATSRDRALRTAFTLDPNVDLSATSESFRGYAASLRDATLRDISSTRYAFYLDPPPPNDDYIVFIDGRAHAPKEAYELGGIYNPYVTHGAYHVVQVATHADDGWTSHFTTVTEIPVVYGQGVPHAIVVSDGSWGTLPVLVDIAPPDPVQPPSGGCAARRAR
jgi:hypothetical protein